MKPISTKQDAPKNVKVEDLRTIDGKVDFAKLEWNSKGISQVMPKSFCKATEHKHPDANGVQYLKIQGRIDGYCHGCKSQWVEVDATFPQAREGNSTSPVDTPAPIDIPELTGGQVIPFPVDAIDGTIFGIWEQAYNNTNETCPAFRFAELATAIGARLGRSVCYRPPNIPHIDETRINDPDFLSWFANDNYYIYPNFYSCLWGEPSESKKSTSIRKARKLKIWDDDMLTLEALSTREGFISALKASEEHTGHPPRALILYDELAGLFSKARQQNSETLISTLNTAYYCPRKIESVTKEDVRIAKADGNTGGISAENISVSFIGGITPYWLQGKMTMEEIGSGFASRFMYFQHEQQELKPEPLPADPYLAYEVYKSLNNIDANAPPRYFQFDSEAREVYNNWYIQNGKNKPSNPIVKLAQQRLQEYAIKTALQVAYFKSNGKDIISLDDFAVGMALADYWGKVIQSIFSEFTDNERTARVRKVIDALQKLGGVNVKRGEILQKIGGGRMTPDEFTKVLMGLVENEYITISGERPQIISVINPAIFDI